jgi:hypothetical protein
VSLSSEDHIRLLQSLIDHQVKFLIIGGHAAIYYGVNRNTGDLDMLIEPFASNGIRLTDALKQIGLEVPVITPANLKKNSCLLLGLNLMP